MRISSVGFEELETYFQRAPEITTQAARMAINDVAQGAGLRLIKDKMVDQIDFPTGYLSADKLGVAKRASNANLEAVIVGRKRATSLARFSSSKVPGKNPVSVSVRKGRTVTMRNAFLVRLKSGASLTEDKFNLGLAVRLKPGETINKKTTHRSWLVPGKVALLYGPSVDQVFSEVADTVLDPIGDLVSAEFFRQFARLSNG